MLIGRSVAVKLDKLSGGYSATVVMAVRDERTPSTGWQGRLPSATAGS